MKTTNFVFLAVFFLLTAILPQKVHAMQISASSAAFVQNVDVAEKDNRVQILTAYLKRYNSPLAGSASTFIEEADKNGLDWKLVVSISGVESWFGNRIPPYSYNGWGYGVYGNNVRRFASWDEAISIISSDLRMKYMNKWKARTVAEIGRIYAADPKWADKVQHFINDIERFTARQERQTLSLSI